MDSYLTLAHQLADASGEIIRKYFRTAVPIETKTDETPVTKADREAETAMRALITKQFPEHGIWGEEHGGERLDAEYVWVLDPIDGTRNFMIGKPIFGTLIGLLRRHVPVLGVVDQPILKERWVGVQGQPATLNGKVIHTRACKRLDHAILSTTSPYLFSEAKREKFEAAQQAAAHTVFGGDCYAYAMLATGYLDLIIESGLKAHDVMALIPIIEGAGGTVTDWQGAPIAYGMHPVDVVACGDKALHPAAVEILSGNP